MSEEQKGIDDTVPEGHQIVELSKQPVELYKILKFESLFSSGGEAKAAIAAGEVLVNDQIETQKRKKIVSGDRIESGDDKLFIRCSSPAAVKVKPAAKNKNKPAARKPIGALSK